MPTTIHPGPSECSYVDGEHVCWRCGKEEAGADSAAECLPIARLVASILDEPIYARADATSLSNAAPNQCPVCRHSPYPGQVTVSDAYDEYAQQYCAEICIMLTRTEYRAYAAGVQEGKNAAKRILNRLIDDTRDPGPNNRCCDYPRPHGHCRICDAVYTDAHHQLCSQFQVCPQCLTTISEIAAEYAT